MPLVNEQGIRVPNKLSRRGAKFIAAFEGGANSAGRYCPYYDDLGGVWTQGFGHTRNVGPGDACWSRRKALRVLRKDAAPLVSVINRTWNGDRPLKQHSMDMLISFGFNLGPGYFINDSSIRRAMRRGNAREVARAIKLYNKAGDPPRPVAGLTRRRNAEARIFIEGYS